MRWQRPLRWGVALAGIGFAVMLVVRYERRAPVSKAPLPPKMADGASFQSRMSPDGRQIRYKNEVEVGSWAYTKLIQLPDGRRVIEKLRYEGDRAGNPFVVTADRAELVAPGPGTDPNVIPEETHLLGNVVMREEGGLELKTEDAMYRESSAILDIPGAMTFSDRRQSGSGVGATYDRNVQVLTLRDQAAVAIAPDESGNGRMDARATTITIDRLVHSGVLDGNASITRDREVITAVRVDMHLTEDNQGVQMMELHQRAGIVPLGGASKTPEMHADEINLEFLPDGRTIARAQLLRRASMFLPADSGRKQITGDMLDVRLGADGQTVTNLSGTGLPVAVTLPASADLPKRVVNAREMKVTGDEQHGLTAADFRARVVFLETRPAARGQAAVEREVRSDELTLAFNDGDISDIKEAHFRSAVRFTNDATSGNADNADYQAKAGKLVLFPSGSAGKRSSVATDRIRVDARNIDLDLDRIIINAKGDLQTTISPGTKTRASLGLFDDLKPVFGKANELSYDEARNEAVYTGTAKLFQEASSIKAGTVLRINDATGDLKAEGGVETQFPMDNLEGVKSAQPKATAATFEYTDANHRAVYTGSGPKEGRAQFNSPDGAIRGITIELFLTDAGRELKRMLVNGEVEARVSADRTARGARLDHDATTGGYVLSGSPATLILRSLDNGAESCSESRGPSMSFTKTKDVKAQGTFTVSDATGAGTRSRNLQSCADWIIK